MIEKIDLCKTAPQSLRFHQGSKYIKKIYSAINPNEHIEIDVYSVLVAFGITCPARQHAIKKLLMAGQRGKGDAINDLWGVHAAVQRAIQLEEMIAQKEVEQVAGRERKHDGEDTTAVAGASGRDGGDLSGGQRP